MAMQKQFSLGLELTSLLQPLILASKVGALAAADAIKCSGSDVLTELKLASIFGRLRIDESMAENFRHIVMHSNHSIISKYLNMVLESGAGPTVQQAAKNPALFSMVVQLSALAFAHKGESLAFAIQVSIERILEIDGSNVESAPEYVSLTGTLRACQQQTISFPWTYFFERVENTIISTTRPSAHAASENASMKEVQTAAAEKATSISNRALPFVVLQSLIMWLPNLQHFQGHRMLHLKCSQGISTIVIWCYFVLGINVCVDYGGTRLSYGQDPCNILIESCSPGEDHAVLLDLIDHNEVLFSLSPLPTDPSLDLEWRADAHGFGRRILELSMLSNEEVNTLSNWIATHAIQLSECCYYQMPNNTCREFSRQQVTLAARFLFAIKQDFVDPIPLSQPSGALSELQTRGEVLPLWAPLFRLVFIFSQIHDLSSCAKLPLSIEAFREQARPFYSRIIPEKILIRELSDLTSSFRLVTHLMLGRCFTGAYVLDAVLVSSWGWSIYLDSIRAEDPSEVSTQLLHIVHGVPTRNGVRKSRIIDGPQDYARALATRTCNDRNFLLSMYPKTCDAKRRGYLIGFHGTDTFAVVQTIEYMSEKHQLNNFKLGFRQMANLCTRTAFTLSCACHVKPSINIVTLAQEIGLKHGRQEAETGDISSPDIPFIYRRLWPSVGTFSDESIPEEMVFSRTKVAQSSTKQYGSDGTGSRHDEQLVVYFYYVSENPAARWLLLCDISRELQIQGDCVLGMRGKSCCIRCAVKYSFRAGHFRQTLTEPKVLVLL